MGLLDLNWLSSKGRALSRNETTLRLIVPPALVGVYYLFCWSVLPPEQFLILGGLIIAYYIPPSGKESLIPVGIALGIPWWLMAATLAILDVITSLFIIANLPLVLKLPRLGPWISRFLASGEVFMAERPWIARWRILGVAFFVFLPLQGTGGVGATLVGMMVGLSPGAILLALAIGGSAEALLFAIGSEIIWNLILSNLFLGLVAAFSVILSAVVIYFVFLYRPRTGR
jgi:uncharacterized membrane protein